MKIKRFMGCFFVIIASLNTPISLSAEEIRGVRFKDSVTVGGKTLNLNGAGLLRYWGFKVYVGALYLEKGYTIEEALSTGAKRIEIEYLRPIKGKDFGSATKKGILRNVDLETFKRLRPQIEYHNSLYKDVQPGDRYSLTYIPGKGTELALNDEPMGNIKGGDFAAAVFSIWLGTKPICESFKKQILDL